MGNYVNMNAAHQNADGTYTATVAAQSNDKKTASVVHATAKTQQDAMEQARKYSDSSLQASGSLSLPLTSPDSDLLNITEETATQDASGALHTHAAHASYEAGNHQVTILNPSSASAASSFSGALEGVNQTLNQTIGSPFDSNASEIAAQLGRMGW